MGYGSRYAQKKCVAVLDTRRKQCVTVLDTRRKQCVTVLDTRRKSASRFSIRAEKALLELTKPLKKC